ncbi:MAG: type II toxin-antitoxin system VapC family toxin [Acidaminococcaceae bacterium]|nr:type II toxin-antitoxin system VapC family toxin [Acidaminococcaceae bacterium]
MYLLDTNICIYAINGRHPRLSQRLLTIHPNDIYISSVTVGELVYGAAKSWWGSRTRQIMYAFLANFTIIPFTEKDAVIFGRCRAGLTAAGTPIGAYDLMIAAQGISRNLTVVTHNMKEFSRVPGIVLEDWIE